MLRARPFTIAGGTVAHLDADLAVTLEEDRPGTLARALGSVSAAGINIDGYAEIGGGAHQHQVLVPGDPQPARDCIRQSTGGAEGAGGAGCRLGTDEEFPRR